MDLNHDILKFANETADFIAKTKYHCKNCKTMFEFSVHNAKNGKGYFNQELNYTFYEPICPGCGAYRSDILKPVFDTDEGFIDARRLVRNMIFRIRDKEIKNNNRIETKIQKERAMMVERIIKPQFRKVYIEGKGMVPMRWGNFTMIWDVGVFNPLKVIEKEQWNDEGGGYDPWIFKKRQQMVFDPYAFTKQE